MNYKSVPIPGYEGYYAISDHGDVYSLRRRIELRNGHSRHVEGRTLAQQKSADGYITVTLSINDVASKKYVHRLVAEAFIENPEKLPEVNHLNGNKTDNRVDNLCWSSHRHNVIHAYENNLSKNIGGSHCFAVGVIDNEIGGKFSTIKDWCLARKINYNTGRNILSGCNSTNRVDKSKIIRISKEGYGEVDEA